MRAIDLHASLTPGRMYLYTFRKLSGRIATVRAEYVGPQGGSVRFRFPEPCGAVISCLPWEIISIEEAK